MTLSFVTASSNKSSFILLHFKINHCDMNTSVAGGRFELPSSDYETDMLTTTLSCLTIIETKQTNINQTNQTNQIQIYHSVRENKN